MKILYLSCHSILEHDEVSLLHELGHEVFSPGAYVEPANPGDASLRPGIPGLVYDPHIVAQYHRLSQKYPGEDVKNYLTREFVDNFDAVIIMHLPRWISSNWSHMSHKRVIWRTIGQSITSTEQYVRPYREKGLQIVRYSPRETRIPCFQGCDALIRFYKDPSDLKDWNGQVQRVITVGQSMKQRDQACNFTFFEAATRGFQRHLFGPGNESVGPWATGKLSYEDLKKEMRDNRVYFYTGTHPASYTLNFIEAWMTGAPVVAIGPKKGNATYFPGVTGLYEIPDLIENGVNGFCYDDIDDLRNVIDCLLGSPALASSIGAAGRQSAIQHFGKDKVREQWRTFLS